MRVSISKNGVHLPAIFLTAGVVLGMVYLAAPWYVFAVSLATAGIFAVGLFKPVYAFYLVLLVLVEEMVQYFISYPPYYEIRIYPYYLPLLAGILGVVVLSVAKKKPLRESPVTSVLWIIVVFDTVSMIWAPHLKIAAWLSVITFLNIALFYLVLNTVVDEATLRRTSYIWIFAGVAVATAIILSQWIDVEKTIYLTKGSGLKMAFQEQVDRPAGLGGVDHVAGYVSMAVFMALGSMAHEKRWKVKAIYFILIMYMLFGIILTTSRGVIIGLTSAYLFFIFINPGFRNRFIKYSFIFFVLFVFTVLVVKPGLIDRMLVGFGYKGKLLFSDKTFTGTEADTSQGQGLSGMEMREIWWKNGLHEMVKHPYKLLVGLGNGGFVYYSSGGNTVTSPEVNSVSFAFFYDMGVFGVLLLIILLYLIVKNTYFHLRNAKRDYCYYMLLASVAALITESGVHGLVDYDLTSYGSKYFWFPLGFAMAVVNIVKDREKAADNRAISAEVSDQGG
ncbi:MAG: hypothetical protein HZB84_08245 [Deltaproteobacteria bacterium]|nr:hypothetical protein [Deltaproteobacteria bacterium]